MLRGLFKDRKIVDYVNSKGKGKKIKNLMFSDNSEFVFERKKTEETKIYSPSGTSIGRLVKRSPMANIRSPERELSPSIKIFPEKAVKTNRTLIPRLQENKGENPNLNLNVANVKSGLRKYTDIFFTKNEKTRQKNEGDFCLNSNSSNCNYNSNLTSYASTQSSFNKYSNNFKSLKKVQSGEIRRINTNNNNNLNILSHITHNDGNNNDYRREKSGKK